MGSSEQSTSSVHIDKYVLQLEKRILEQEQLIALLNEKLAAVTSSSKAGAEAGTSGTGARHTLRKPDDRGVAFVGSRKSDNVQVVANTKYTSYFVTRVHPDVTAEVLAKDLLSNVEELSSVRCTKMKTKHISYASFQVVIPADQGHLVESDGAWPEGSFVKLFSGRLLPAYIKECFDSNAPTKEPEKPKKTTLKKPDPPTGKAADTVRDVPATSRNAAKPTAPRAKKPVVPPSANSPNQRLSSGSNFLSPKDQVPERKTLRSNQVPKR